MSKFIKLTILPFGDPSYDNKPIYISLNAIESFYQYEGCTVVAMLGNSSAVKVCETPEQILKLIKATE